MPKKLPRDFWRPFRKQFSRSHYTQQSALRNHSTTPRSQGYAPHRSGTFQQFAHIISFQEMQFASCAFFMGNETSLPYSNPSQTLIELAANSVASYKAPNSRKAALAPSMFISFISAYFRESTTPGAPASSAARVAAFTSEGWVRFSFSPVGISMSIPG